MIGLLSKKKKKKVKSMHVTGFILNFRAAWSDLLKLFCELLGIHEPQVNNLSIREKNYELGSWDKYLQPYFPDHYSSIFNKFAFENYHYLKTSNKFILIFI